MRDLIDQLKIVNKKLLDQEWRIFKIWQKSCPDQPFETYCGSTIRKMAIREGINVSNIIDLPL